jgi:CheY-like chemotaxis protein
MVMPGSEGGKVILIVDDDEVTRDSCFQVLSKEGYTVVTACNGETGLAEAKRYRPDLLLIDLNMPGISGFEVIDLLNSVNSKMQKVVITGNTTIDLDKEIIDSGRASGYLRKPFIPEELKSMVQKALNFKPAVEQSGEQLNPLQRLDHSMT